MRTKLTEVESGSDWDPNLNKKQEALMVLLAKLEGEDAHGGKADYSEEEEQEGASRLKKGELDKHSHRGTGTGIGLSVSGKSRTEEESKIEQHSTHTMHFLKQQTQLPHPNPPSASYSDHIESHNETQIYLCAQIYNIYCVRNKYERLILLFKQKQSLTTMAAISNELFKFMQHYFNKAYIIKL